MKINIIGGGITGLATGLALQKVGITNFSIFEKASELNEVGAGIMMQPNAMKILDWLGVGQQVRESGIPIDRAVITDHQLRSLRQALKGTISDVSGQHIIAIHRARLQKILYEALPGGKLQLGTPLMDCQYVGDQVKAIFPDENVLSDVLLGADGIHSQVRQKLFPKTPLRYSGQTCWRGIAHFQLPKKLIFSAHEAWGPDMRFGFAGISSTEVYWFAVVKAQPGGRDAQHEIKHYLKLKFADFHSLITNLIDHTEDNKVIRNDIYDLRRLDTWHQDRICLIGDAAHATTPNLGQGACQGLEDAFFLSQQLVNQPDYQQAFATFERLRRKKVDEVVNTSWQLGRLAHHSLGQQLVRLIMWLTPERVVTRQMQKMFEVEGL